MSEKGFVPVGKVIKVHGLKGELCITWYADSPFLIAQLSRIYLKTEGRHPRQQVLGQVRSHSKGLLVSLESVQGRDQARQWLGAEVWVRRRDVPDSAAHLLRDLELLGSAVYLQSGGYLGRIESVDHRTGQEMWTIATPAGREVLLPAVPEFVREIDVHRALAYVCPPPGLLELYDAQDQTEENGPEPPPEPSGREKR
ncbi:ribosome maturation factor RimM [Desulfovermiculus halophilus]|jgi:16S rRNA processing protein RimM|uniref:ribosome maturation factor RimM n=1 Tax=Desulfovermiculus halophilus TaxID=339722 RepID=UPI0006846FD3|nr:ribosome maturation factor RimM [Desulfovermiculus halophilus]